MNIECKYYARTQSLATVNSPTAQTSQFVFSYRVLNERAVFFITLNYMPTQRKGASLCARIMHIIVHIYFNNNIIKLRISQKFLVSWEYN